MLPNHSTTACWHGKAVVRGTTGVRPALLDCLRHRWCCHAGWVRLPTAEGVPRAGGGAPGRKECFPALGATGAGCTGCGATARVDEGAQRAPHPNGTWEGGGGEAGGIGLGGAGDGGGTSSLRFFHSTASLGGGGGAGMHWKRGGGVPLQGAQPTPSHCPPDGKCQLQWHL